MKTPKQSYKKARVNKDKSFDGLFFFGVLTTGIFCRPSCPSPTAKEENVRYFDNIYLAIKNGFRACKRCYPDIYTNYSSDNIKGEIFLKKAVDLILKGYLNNKSVKSLADKLEISDRHLRKIFLKELGVSPIKFNNYNRIIYSKKLLLNSDLSITSIAFKSGFGSIRQFNKVFKDFISESPSDFRKSKK